MNEYICKEDTLKLASVSESEDEWVINIYDMDKLPTVTKADIRAEVIEQIIKEFERYCGKQLDLIPKGVWEILYEAKEMEQGEIK